MEEILNIAEFNHLSPPASHLWVLGIDIIAIFSVGLWLREIWLARRAAELAKRTESNATPLYEGARFLTGDVEFASGSNAAVRITIGQTGRESLSQKNRSHTWHETTRETEAQPFYVRTKNGERVRVEPPKDVMLVDKLDQMEWTSATFRRRRAELTAGEHVIIEGRLERGSDPEAREAATTYRSNAPVGWVMRDTKRRGMHISTEGLSKRHELRARAFLRALWIVALIECMVLGLMAPYHVRLALGRNVVGNYDGKGFYETTDSKRRVVPHYTAMVSYQDDSGDVYSEHVEVNSGVYDTLPTRDRRIWIRYVPRKSWATALGIGASVNAPMLLFCLTFEVIAMIWMVRAYRRKRWYEAPLVQQMPGELPPPTLERFRLEPIEPPPTAPRPAAPDVEPISANFSAGSEQERQD